MPHVQSVAARLGPACHQQVDKTNPNAEAGLLLKIHANHRAQAQANLSLGDTEAGLQVLMLVLLSKLPKQDLISSSGLLALRANQQRCSACGLHSADLHSAVLRPSYEEPGKTSKQGAA